MGGMHVICLTIHALKKRLERFQCGAIRNKAAINPCVQVFV